MRFKLYALIVLLLAVCFTKQPSRFGVVNAKPGTQGAKVTELPHTWPEGAWQRHTIDDSFLGAGGTRLADINGDGLLDITTPWEQGGQVRVYLNPGNRALRDH